MRKSVMILGLALIMILTLAIGVEAAPRDVEWGQSMATVESLERDRDSVLINQNEDMMFYEIEIGGIDTVLAYGFNQNHELARAIMMATGDDMERIEAFMTYGEIVTERYGDEDDFHTEWHPREARWSYDLDDGDLILALLDGKYSFISLWELEDMEIMSGVYTENEIFTFIGYVSTEYAEGDTEPTPDIDMDDF